MRSPRFIVLSSLLAITLLAWLLSYSLGTAMQWSRVYRQGNILHLRTRFFQYGIGQLRVEWGGMQVWVPPSSSKAESQWRHLFPPFKKLTPVEHPWGPGAFAIGALGFLHIETATDRVTAVGVPFWFPTALLAIIPLRFAFRRWLAADRRRRGLCPGCGYDLRATAGLCPECGKAPETQVLAAECGPAIVATARSSGTKAVVILAAYLTASTFLVAESFIHWQAPLLARELTVLGAMLLVLIGAFHAAGFSRSGEGLFGFGCLAGLLLLPLYVRLGNYTSPAVQVTISLGCLILMGVLARTSGVLRWRMQDGT